MSSRFAGEPATQQQLAGKVERLRRELALLYRSDSGWNTAAINRVADDLTKAEYALADIEPGSVDTLSPHPAGVPWAGARPA